MTCFTFCSPVFAFHCSIFDDRGSVYPQRKPCMYKRTRLLHKPRPSLFFHPIHPLRFLPGVPVQTSLKHTNACPLYNSAELINCMRMRTLAPVSLLPLSTLYPHLHKIPSSSFSSLLKKINFSPQRF